MRINAFIFLIGFFFSGLLLQVDQIHAESTSIEQKIIIRQMTAEEHQKQSQRKGEDAVNPLVTAPANNLYGSGGSMFETPHKRIKGAQDVLRTSSKSPIIKRIMAGLGKSVRFLGKALDILDKVTTGSNFFGSLSNGDLIGATESLINMAGSGLSAGYGATKGAVAGGFIAGPGGAFAGGIVGGYGGAKTWNEGAAPEVAKAGDKFSNFVQDLDEVQEKEKRAVRSAYTNDYNTVYPHGYMGSGMKDVVTGQIDDLRPDVLHLEAEKVRENKRQGTQITVPKVEEKSLVDAIHILKNADLFFTPVGGDPAPSKDLAGYIQEQRPKAGSSLNPEGMVTLVIYSEFKIPEGMLVVPSITTLNLQDAKNVLDKHGLRFNPVFGKDPSPSKKQVGTLQSQRPVEGEYIKEGGEVKAWVYGTVAPSVIGKPVKIAEDMFKAAWFKPNSVPGKAVKNKNLWNTIYKQTVEAGKNVEKTGVKVTLTYYKKTEPKKENPYLSLLGTWKGSMYKTHITLNILDVDTKGNFTAHLIWPKQKYGCSDTTTLVKGSVNGSKIVLGEMRVLIVRDKCKRVSKYRDMRNKFEGTWDRGTMRMQGTYFHYGNLLMSGPGAKNVWFENGTFNFKKQ